MYAYAKWGAYKPLRKSGKGSTLLAALILWWEQATLGFEPLPVTDEHGEAEARKA